MNTPICDFVRRYADSGLTRLHMPGHKGNGPLGCEQLDITEVHGADSLYQADGIIAQSESNASALFACPTFYSTEGSSQCIRAMVYLAMLYAKSQGKHPWIAAGRNAHKSFLSAVALLNPEVTWIYGKKQDSYLSCGITAEDVENLDPAITALYITSPDYWGNMADIAALADACKKKGILLLVDNAHGAYLRFLPQSMHPMDLGADICCDSAHKTLPVLTGGAYLHIRNAELARQAKNALALFGSTSPSYLILQSLDAANRYLSEGYPLRLAEHIAALNIARDTLRSVGYTFIGNEPMKLTVQAKSYGYTGTELADALRSFGIECEFSDPDYLVLMPSPEMGTDALLSAVKAMCQVPKLEPISITPPLFFTPKQVCSVRQALLRPSKTIPIEESLGHVLASPSVGCPPAVPILVCGEQINESAIACFRYYGICQCNVL